MHARRTDPRRAAAVALLVLAIGLGACTAVGLSARPPSAEALMRSFDEGDVHLDCASCRFDFRGSEWALEQGDHEALVLRILRSGDGSGRSWYLLGRVAEASDRRELALRYYRQSLTTPRNPITALWPLYEDVRYRARRLAAKASPEPAGPAPASAPRPAAIELVNVESLVVATRPGPVGAFVEKLRHGDPVDVLDRSGDWEQIRLADGRVGWVWGDYTSVSGSPAEADRGQVAAAKPEEKEPAKKSAPRPAKRAKRIAAKPRPAAKTEVAKAPAPAPAPVAATPPAPPRELQRSSAAGILGAPLPSGASLAGRTHGATGSDDHPTETYQIEAVAAEIVGFFEREMEGAGWRKSFVSSEYLLYFEKGERTIGVLVDRQGGLFTLMGS